MENWSQFQLADLKKMNLQELESLASDIRKLIIESVSINGGHLSSNLGVIELTIALHKVFDSPHDKIIFDVSHQCYTHKILTGRANEFMNLRKSNGISGFIKNSESEHDIFEAGHSSTSLSAGLGFLEAKKSGIDIGEVIAVIGDASITNGVAFEALNYLGAHPEQKMIIVLNDNEMSISKNVGALAKEFNKIRGKGSFKFLRKITPNAIKRMLKSYAYHQNIFESLGIKYFEGIDGHNFKDLIKYLNYAKDSSSSVLLHIKTQKGKGYPFSEEDASGYWHHVEPFDITSGTPKNNTLKKTYGEAISNHLIKLIDEGNKEIRVITPAMILGSGLTSFQNQYREYLIDVGIAEENAIVMAASMAQSGLKPIVFIYSTFLQRGYDEIIHDIGRTGQKVILCVDRSGIIDDDGDTHQGIYDVAYLSSIPNLKILAPKNITEAIFALDYALDYQRPVVIRYPKNDENGELKFLASSDFLRWDIVRKSSHDLPQYVISYGNLLHQLCEELPNTVGIINAKNLSDLDKELLNYLSEINSTVYVYEEVIKNGSLGSLIVNYVYENQIKLNVKAYSLPNCYLEVGKRKELIKKYLPDLKSIIEKK